MGEKIRDLHSIKIGSSELMIELNEGNTKAEGHLIHVQNKHFRFLAREKEFMELAATILRAFSEMKYYKTTGWKKAQVPEIGTIRPADEETKKACRKVADKLNEAQIEYRLVDMSRRRVTWIIRPEDKKRYRELLEKEPSFVKQEHPYGKTFGYTFLYQMYPFELFEVDGVYQEVYFQLPCMSLTPKTWVPLDRMIQGRTWAQREERGGILQLDEICRYIYRLCYAVFKKNRLAENDREMLEQAEAVLEQPEFRQCMEMVFFGFTEDLIGYLKERRFDEIIPAYYAFDKY